MKSLAVVIVCVAILGLMVFTNPSLQDFGNYVRQRVIEESRKDVQDPVGQFLGSLAGGLAGGLVSTQTVRTDFIFFSLYDLQMGKEQLKALGIFKNFVLLEKPDFKHLKMEKGPNR